MGRRKRDVETIDYAGMMRRLIRAHGRRVAEADPEDLRDMLALRGELDSAIAEAVAGQRANGHSWTHIADAAGTSRQAAQQRWGTK